MMQLIRSNLKIVMGVVLLVVAAFIGTIFLVWGRGGDQAVDEPAAAWVGEKRITRRDHELMVSNMVRFYQNIYKEMSAGEIEKRFDIRKSALDSLIARQVALDEAVKMGLTVSDDELRQKIVSNPAFQRDGVFDRSLYLQIVDAMSQTPDQFEASLKVDLLAQKVEQIVKQGVKVSEDEVREEFRRTSEKATLQYVVLPLESFRDGITVGEADLKARFEANKADYAQPERIKVEYLRIDGAALAAGVAADQKDAEAFFAENQREFETPKQVRARHILFRLEPTASAEEEKKIRDRATTVLEKAKGGADFAVLAKEFSQDGSAKEGGDLGFFTREEMVPEFGQAAFSLEKGKVGDLVRTQFGFHIIKVEDVREPRTPSFEEARDRVMARLRQVKGKEKARELASAVGEAILDKSLAQAGSQFGLEVRETGFFSLDEPVPGLALSKDVRDRLFALSKDELSEQIQWGGGFYFFRLVDRREAHAAELNEVRDRVEKDVRDEKARARAKGAAEAVKRELASGTSPEKAATGKSQGGTTAPFPVNGFVPELGVPGDRFEEAFAGTVGSTGGPVDVPRGVAVWRLAGKTSAEAGAWDREKKGIADRLAEEKSTRFFEAWIDQMRKSAGVKLEGQGASAL
jgi:peptidyl-prolyl cis-trans isomerase D